MALMSLAEVFRLVIMTAGLGYIFMDYIKRPQTATYDHLSKKGFDWDSFKFAALVTAPGIILHELGHKFVGLAMGIQTEFFASYFGLFIGIFLKVISSPFIIFAPGYVRLSGLMTPVEGFLTAFAGPAMNLVLFAIAHVILDRKKSLTQKQATLLYMTKRINLFLFLFNLIPLPPFDGYSVFRNLFAMFF